MNEPAPLKVIVPDKKGIEALASIPGVEAILVEPTQSIPATASNADILVVGPAEQQHEVDAALKQISQLPNLKLLQTLGQGVEQWEGVLPPNVTVSTARGAHGGSTAELVVATLLALVRDLPCYIKNQHQHLWEGRQARTLQKMNIFIYGSGDVGQNIQRRLLPFGAQLTMVGTHSRDDVVDVATARTLLPTAGAVIMALPLTSVTQYIVDADFLALLPAGAIVINAGRGGLVDHAALLKELNNGRLQAALDVVTPEPLPTDDALWDAPGLLLTPHVGGNTIGADDRAWDMASRQISDFSRGELSN